MIEEHKSYKYAYDVVHDLIELPKSYYQKNENKKFVEPKYIKKQCQEFLDIADNKNEKYCINEDRVKKIDVIAKSLVMAKGLKAGQPIYDSLAGYQWLLIIASLCTVYRDDMQKRKYQTVLLEICRKNGKTFIVAFLFLLLFYLEPNYSRFFSVAPDGSLAKEIKQALEPLINTNIDLFEENEFKILRDSIKHKPTSNVYYPLNYSTNRLDGKEVGVFICDEVGALPNAYPIEAMRSGQLMTKNKLGFIISTKYPTLNNPFEDEVKYSKQNFDNVLDVKDETVFALLFEPDDDLIDKWATDDLVLLQSNPLAIEIEDIYIELLRKRSKAIVQESVRENFVTKHCNIIFQGSGTESFVDINDVQKCEVDKIDWEGKEVYLGVDLAMSNDNCSVAMCSVDDDNNILAYAMPFIPEGRIDEKNKFEHIDYRKFIRANQCIACGDKTVDYAIIEDFVFNIEKKFNVKVKAIGYDRFNALSSAQKWERGIEGKYHGYNCVVIRQHSDTLHLPTKLLSEKIADHKFIMEKNKIFEINFENARCTYDTNLNRYVNKKKSNGKVDMVVSLINSIFLLQQDVIFADNDFVVQVF